MSSNIKKSFDATLAKFVRGDQNLVFIAIVDREGIAISYVAKSRKYTPTSQQVGSIIKAVSFPAADLVKLFNMGDIIAQVFVLQDASLFLFNLGNAYLVILEKIYGFPISKTKVFTALEKIKPLLNQLRPEKSDMLKELDEKIDIQGFRELSAGHVQKVADFLDHLDGGTLDVQSFSLGNKDLKVSVTGMLKKLTTSWMPIEVAHDLAGEVKAQAGISSPPFAKIMAIMFKVAADQLPALAKGSFLFTFATFENGDGAFSYPVGKSEDAPLILSGYIKNHPALKDILSIPMTVARSLKDVAGSDLSLKTQEIFDFLNSPASSFQATIQECLKADRVKDAKKYMLRAVEILSRSGDYAGAGDYLRWTGFAYFKLKKVEKAKNYYLEAAKSHEFGQAYTKTGDDYKDLANLSLQANDLASTFEYYTQASFFYSKANVEAEFDKIEEERSKLLKKFAGEIKDLIDKSASEIVKLDYISSKLSLREERIIEILRDLITEGQVTGMLDEGKGRFLKKVLAPMQAPVKLEPIELMKQQMRESAITPKPTLTTDLLNQIGKQEIELSKWERIFQQINLPFTRYLEYQEILDKKQFLEQKLKALGISQPFSTQDGTAVRCSICFQEIQTHQPICRCVQNHPSHINCMSVWVQRQSLCPVCDTKLLPHLLKTAMPNEISAQQDMEAREAIITQLRERLKKTENELKQKTQVIHEFASIGTKEEDLFKKLMNERDERAKLEMILAQKEKNIQELKSLLNVFKKG